MIVKAKALGFTLSEIKETLAEGTTGEPNSLALSSSQIADQIAHLEKQQVETRHRVGGTPRPENEALGISGGLSPNHEVIANST